MITPDAKTDGMTYEEYRDAVIREVKSRIGHLDWYRGCCCDTVREDFDAGKTVEQAADAAEMHTAMWDRPGGMFG